MTDKETDALNREAKVVSATLLALITYGADATAITLCITKLKALMATAGGGGQILVATIDGYIGGTVDGTSLNKALGAIVTGVTGPFTMVDARTDRCNDNHLALWASRVRDLVRRVVEGESLDHYPALVGALGILHDLAEQDGLVDTAKALGTLLGICVDAPTQMGHWSSKWVERLILQLIELKDDRKLAGLIPSQGQLEASSFQALPNTPPLIMESITVVVNIPTNYTDTEYRFLCEALQTHLKGYGQIIPLQQGDPIPDSAGSSILWWPGRCIPLKGVKAYMPYTFIKNGVPDDRAPRLFKVADFNGVNNYPVVPPTSTTLETSKYVAHVDGFVAGNLAHKMEVASLVTWGSNTFSFLVDRVGLDYTYRTDELYNPETLDKYKGHMLDYVGAKDTTIAGPKLGPNYDQFPISTTKVVAPDVVVLVAQDTTTDERGYIEQAMPLLFNVGAVYFVNEGQEPPKGLKEDVVLWPTRTTPIAGIDMSYVRVFKKTALDGVDVIDTTVPVWTKAANLDQRCGLIDNSLPMDTLAVSKADYVAEVHGLIFGITARKLERVSVAKWDKQAFHHLRGSLVDTLRYKDAQHRM